MYSNIFPVFLNLDENVLKNNLKRGIVHNSQILKVTK